MHITIDKDALLNVLTKILPKPQSGKLIIDMTLLDPGESRTLLAETNYKFAVMLIEGNGDPEVVLLTSIGEEDYRLRGNDQTIILVANESVRIEALKGDTTYKKTTPRIQLAYIAW
jgi:hypothetical protein